MRCSPVVGSVLLVSFAVACDLATAPPEVPLTVPDVALGVGGGAVGSATGSGHYQDQGGLRTFSFNAVGHADGSATGHAQFNNRLRNAGGNGLQFSLDALCMNFFAPNRALVIGTVKHVNPASTNPVAPLIPIGAPVLFAVEDNGEGKNAIPDRTTPWVDEGLWNQLVAPIVGPLPADFVDVFCSGAYDGYAGLTFLFLRDIEKGNIQVRAP